MKLRLSLILLPVALLAGLPAGTGLADEKPKQPLPWLADDVQDVIYLGDSRPVLFRLHLSVDGKPYSAVWHGAMKRLFQYLDRDDNGFLDPTEQGRMPSAQQFLMQVRNVLFQANGTPPPPLATVDTDGNGKVSFEEFVLYYQKNDCGPARLTISPIQGQQTSALTETLFNLLDTNKDGKLSRAELEAAPNVLRKFDLDDDELVTAAELQNQNPLLVGRQQLIQPVNPQGQMGPQTQAPFLVVPRGAGRANEGPTQGRQGFAAPVRPQQGQHAQPGGDRLSQGAVRAAQTQRGRADRTWQLPWLPARSGSTAP